MSSVKTAISMEERLFLRSQECARKMRVSRSQFFALAAEEFLHRHQGRELLEKLNQVYAKPQTDETELRQARKAAHRRRVMGTW